MTGLNILTCFFFLFVKRYQIIGKNSKFTNSPTIPEKTNYRCENTQRVSLLSANTVVKLCAGTNSGIIQSCFVAYALVSTRLNAVIQRFMSTTERCDKRAAAQPALTRCCREEVHTLKYANKLCTFLTPSVSSKSHNMLRVRIVYTFTYFCVWSLFCSVLSLL